MAKLSLIGTPAIISIKVGNAITSRLLAFDDSDSGLWFHFSTAWGLTLALLCAIVSGRWLVQRGNIVMIIKRVLPITMETHLDDTKPLMPKKDADIGIMISAFTS